jgi:two-component system, chemotaxis family, CheB/CheR fusion protein
MDPSHIVGLVSSAEDLAAVSELLCALPAECGAALIIVQQFGAGSKRSLAEALAMRTGRPVIQATDGMVAERDHVYVIPASAILTMTGRRIRVSANGGGLHHPGDLLFTSLAKECGDSAVGVVLSGAGSDGAVGVQAIKRVGGITFAQYPGSARFPGMPISAIETGCVTFVLRPNEIARELSREATCAAGAARPAPVIGEEPSLAARRIMVSRFSIAS